MEMASLLPKRPLGVDMDIVTMARNYREKMAARNDRSSIDSRLSEIRKQFDSLTDEKWIEEEEKKKDATPEKRTSLRNLRSPPKVKYSNRDKFGCNVNGKSINRGIKEGKEEMHAKDCEFFKKKIRRKKIVSSLTTDEIRYLLTVEFREYLEGIKSDTVESRVREFYMESIKSGKGLREVLMMNPSTLFTDEQVDYINGCLIGAYHLKTFPQLLKHQQRKINVHDDMDLVSIVLQKEALASIVKYVHKFDTYEETIEYMDAHALENVDSDG